MMAIVSEVDASVSNHVASLSSLAESNRELSSKSDMFVRNDTAAFKAAVTRTTATVFQSGIANYSVDSEYDPFDAISWSTDLWLRHSLPVSAGFCVAYCLVFVLGIIGNSFVVAVVLRSPRMRTVTNYFIVNLALADILVLVFCLPATLIGNLFVPWILGLFMCKAVSFLQGVAVGASINTLVAVSIDRFLAICYPLRCQISRRSAHRIILVIWIFSVIVASPWALYFTIVPMSPDFSDIPLCIEMWPNEMLETLYFVICNMVLCYVFPLCVITACYLGIWCKVWRRTIPGDTKNNQLDVVMQRSKLKVVKMMIVVVVIFVLSWLPLYVIFGRIKLGGHFVPDSVEEKMVLVMSPIAQWLGASNSCINPILYAFFNQKFRNGFAAIVKSKKCCGSVTYREQLCARGTTIRSAASRATTRFETQCEYLSEGPPS